MEQPRVQKTDHIRHIQMTPDMRKRVADYAEHNGMSVSEVLREAMDGFVVDAYEPRKRVLERVTAWIPPEEYSAFAKKARASGITIIEAIERALEKVL